MAVKPESVTQQRVIALHSENGPGVGGSDFVMGKIADSLDPESWRVLAMVSPAYPHETVFRQIPFPTPIGDRLASNSGQMSAVAAEPRRTGSPTLLGWRRLRTLVPTALRRRRGYARAVARGEALLRRHGVEIFQTMDGGPQPTTIAAKQAGCMVVGCYSAPPPEGHGAGGLTQSYSLRSFHAADVKITMSHANAEAWANYLGVQQKSFRVIYNGVRLPESSDTSSVREELRIPASAVVVGMTGRMAPNKGPQVLARAAVALAQEFPSVHYVFTGDGQEVPKLAGLFAEAGLSSRVRLLGFRSDAARLTSGYDIAVVPSIFAEPFGLVVTEAMAAAKPVVASRTGGIPEIVVDGESGLLVPPGDSATLASALARLIRNPDEVRKMGSAGRRRVGELFTLDRMAREYTELYESLLASRS